jgi:tRNA A-37 threonylcarbamoyl transferase component Bud32
MDLTGRHLGKYELLEKVGQGGMAYVYKAHQPTIDRHVAVKVLHSHLADDAEFLTRFKREAQGLGRLRHPHIVSVIDFDVDDGWYYMVMDYIEGETLEAYLDRRGRLPLAEALRLMAQVTSALAYAHDNGRIHRDIKPSNVMFADDAQRHAVITDFGLTRLLDNATLTLSGTIAGTPAYMSPEAAQGQKTDARSDIYSLGVMLYEMVTGQRPFLGETPLSIIMKLVIEPLPPALSINPELPPAVDTLLQKAMAKQPEERYQTAAEMLAAVQAVAGGKLPVVNGEAEPDRTQLLRAETAVLPAQPAAINTPLPAAAKRPFWPWLLGAGLLLAALLVGLLLVLSDGVKPVDETAVPTQAVVAEDLTPAGTLRFAEPDGNNLRQYTLALDNVPPAPDGFHYELWFYFAGQPQPENVARLVAQNDRITYADVLVESLAVALTAVQVSLEPGINDDPAISTAVILTGTVGAESGLAEIRLFAGQP